MLQDKFGLREAKKALDHPKIGLRKMILGTAISNVMLPKV